MIEVRIAFVLIFLVLFLPNGTTAGSPPKEVFDYLRPILEHELIKAPDVWEKTGFGGYVLRFDLDVTGDGIQEMFLGSTLESWKTGVQWKAYRQSAGHEYDPYRYTSPTVGLGISMTGLWLEQDGANTKIVGFGSDQGKYYVGRYSFRDTQVDYHREEVDESTFERLKLSPRLKRVIPEVSGVLLADLLRNPDAEWKRIDFDAASPSPDGYYIAAEDVEKIKNLTNFTPSLAVKWIETAAAGKEPAEALLPTPVPSPVIKTPLPPGSPAAEFAPEPTVALTDNQSAENKTKVWPWLMGILALLAIVLLFAKRRR
jgi:hypothetical protein